jgi:hypothetical protein
MLGALACTLTTQGTPPPDDFARGKTSPLSWRFIVRASGVSEVAGSAMLPDSE